MARRKTMRVLSRYMKYKIIVLSISLTLAGIMFYLCSALYYKQFKIEGWNPLDFFIIGLLLILGPYSFYESFWLRYIESIEERLPDLLRDLSESIRFGMTLAEAIMKAAKGNYGGLTPSVKRMATQVEWGVNATEAFQRFADDVDTPMVRSSVAIVIKGDKAGGDIADVLATTANSDKEIQLLRTERRTEMSGYVAVVYTTFFVFLAVILILNSIFLPAMEETTESSKTEAGYLPVSISTVSLSEIQFIYFCAAVVQGLGNGTLAGLIDSGSIVYGQRHSFIMILSSFIILKFLLI